MNYQLKRLGFDPSRLNGLSEKLIVSHWENNYGGAVKRLNAIEQSLAELSWANAPVFDINGLKREELIASGSMILHEIYFDSLGGTGGVLRAHSTPRSCAISVHWKLGELNSSPWERLRAATRMDAAGMESASRPFGQCLGFRPCAQSRRGHAARRARYVRAQLPHGLWRQSRRACRRLHAKPFVDGCRGGFYPSQRRACKINVTARRRSADLRMPMPTKYLFN